MMGEQKQTLAEEFGEVSEALHRLWVRTLAERCYDDAKEVAEAFCRVEMLRLELIRVPWE